MLFEIVFQSDLKKYEGCVGCDLMLFEIVFQLEENDCAVATGCDLMLFEIVFQFGLAPLFSQTVVI